MKHFDCKLGALALVTVASATAFSSGATSYRLSPDSRLGKQLQTVQSVREFRGVKPFTINDLEKKINTNPDMRRAAVDEPTLQFNDLSQFAYITAPDGDTWFYTTDYKIEEVTIVDPDFPSFSYTEEQITGFTFTIYDSSFREVGTVTDKIVLAENETRAAAVSIDPTVSVKFFNTDDNPEIMVYFAMNTVEYINHYYYKVYSIGGETDEDGNNISLKTLEGRCIDTVKSDAVPGEEDYYFTFVSDAMVDLDANYDSYIDFLNSYVYRVTTFTKADADGNLKELFSKDVFCSRVPGDTTDGVYFISKPHDGKMYFIFSEYEKPYFVDPTGMAGDESATPDNSLIIEVYSTDGTAPELVSTTSIPVETVEVEGALIYSFYSIGSVAWKHDIDMLVHGTKTAPAFIVARDVMNAATYEEVTSSYSIYNNEGKLVKTLATDTESMVLFADNDSEQPQMMYVSFNDEGNYIFSFTGLYDGETLFTIDQGNDGDPISASCDRVKQPDGSYKYAFEMTYYENDGEDNEYIRVAWYNGDGSFDHIDRIQIGKDVQAAAVNMASSMLNPTLFDNDSLMEYAVIVKRSVGPMIKTEFVIVNDNGEWYAHFSEDEGKGFPFMFSVLFGETNRLMMVYNDNYRYNVDLYDLPFVNVTDAIEGIEAENASGIRYDGAYVYAPDCLLTVYNTSGMKLASASDNLSVADLSTGVYVVVATDAAGNRTAVKIAR